MKVWLQTSELMLIRPIQSELSELKKKLQVMSKSFTKSCMPENITELQIQAKSSALAAARELAILSKAVHR